MRCVALLGGTFDPVHLGHVALATHWMQLLGADELRVLPALPWQKASLGATADQRADMAQLAFTGQRYPVVIDRQELERGTLTFTVDTLRNLRAQLGNDVSLAFLMGADQLQKLDTWRDWRALFELAHICAAARPGFALDQLPAAVQEEIQGNGHGGRLATPERVRTTPAGSICLAPDLAVDMSSTSIRAALQRGEQPSSLISPVVLDYIEQHNLYK